MWGNWREGEDVHVTWAKAPSMKQPEWIPCDRVELESENISVKRGLGKEEGNLN